MGRWIDAGVCTSVLALLLCGCSVQKDTSPLGSWQTGPVLSEWGSNRITLTFYADGHFSQTNRFEGGGVLGIKGAYQVRDSNIIIRSAKGQTQEIPFAISGDTMRLKVGNENYTFRRSTSEERDKADKRSSSSSELVPTVSGTTSAQSGGIYRSPRHPPEPGWLGIGGYDVRGTEYAIALPISRLVASPAWKMEGSENPPLLPGRAVWLARRAFAKEFSDAPSWKINSIAIETYPEAVQDTTSPIADRRYYAMELVPPEYKSPSRDGHYPVWVLMDGTVVLPRAIIKVPGSYDSGL